MKKSIRFRKTDLLDTGILLAEYRDQDACNQARADSMKEILEFLEGWK